MGDILNGRFSIVETISENRLYKAVDTATGSFTAIKKWKYGEVSFNNELSALMSIAHSAMPRLVDCFHENGSSYIAEEWIDGGSIASLSAFPVITDFAVSCTEFLCFLTADKNNMRIHGDIKPSNIMLRNGKVCFIDFESSVKVENARTSKRNAHANVFACAEDKKDTLRLASEYFTAPEVFFGKASPQSDIYSLGMVLAWMLGCVDEDGVKLDSISDACSLKPIISKCLPVNVKERFADAHALMKALERITSKNVSIKTAAEIHKIKFAQDMKFSLYVDCNVCFGWELALTASVFFGMKTCVIALTERTQRKLSYYAESDRYYGEEFAEEEALPYIFDYKSLYQRNAESWYSKGLIHRSEDCENLFYSGYRLHDELEPDGEQAVSKLIDWGKVNFDCVIFVTDRYDDKQAVRNLTAGCDFTIATPLANIDDIEACKNYYEKFGGNVLYAAWEFNDKYSLPEESIAIIVGEDRYLGAVSHDEERTIRRNYLGKIRPIFHSDADSNIEDVRYINIINRLFHAVYGRNDMERVSV